MMPYRTVLFDLDHTLIDSDRATTLAFDDALRSLDVEPTASLTSRFEAINAGLWDRVEAGEMTPNDVRATRFIQLFREAGIDLDSDVVGDRYVTGLGAHGELYPGVVDVLDQLAPSTTMGIVTNGIGEVQRARIERLSLDRWFDAFIISGEVGVSKPDPAIFDLAFEALGQPDRASTLMVGDSLRADMAGGAAAGIDTAWLKRDGQSPNGVPITYEIESIANLITLVGLP